MAWPQPLRNPSPCHCPRVCHIANKPVLRPSCQSCTYGCSARYSAGCSYGGPHCSPKCFTTSSERTLHGEDVARVSCSSKGHVSAMRWMQPCSSAAAFHTTKNDTTAGATRLIEDVRETVTGENSSVWSHIDPENRGAWRGTSTLQCRLASGRVGQAAHLKPGLVNVVKLTTRT